MLAVVCSKSFFTFSSWVLSKTNGSCVFCNESFDMVSPYRVCWLFPQNHRYVAFLLKNNTPKTTPAKREYPTDFPGCFLKNASKSFQTSCPRPCASAQISLP